MSKRPLIFLTIGLTAIALAFVLNFLTVLQPSIKEKYIDKDIIAGMEIVHQDVPFTLNFEQQNRIIDIINRSSTYEGSILPSAIFDKLILYTFDKGNIEIKPMGYLENRLVFSSPKLHTEGYLIENDKALHSIIPTLYDTVSQEK